MPAITLIDSALLQGLGISAAVLGVCFAFRVLRYPDLTADGSFIIGAAVFGASLHAGVSWPAAMVFSVAAGASAGCLTAMFHLLFGVHRLLSGILTTMCTYSLAFRTMSNQSNLGLLDLRNIFTRAVAQDEPWASGRFLIHPHTVGVLLAAVTVCGCVIFALLRSDLGLVLRASGLNVTLLQRLGHSSRMTTLVGLAVANGLVGLAGAIVSSRQGFVDANMGTGVIITLIAGLILGEQLFRWLGSAGDSLLSQRIAAPVFGAFVYSLLYLGIIRASLAGVLPFDIQPTDIKMISALVLAIVVAIRLHKQKRESSHDVLPI